MLKREELVKALITNLNSWEWDLFTQYPIDEDTGRALVRVFNENEFETKQLKSFVNDMSFGDEYARNQILHTIKTLKVQNMELEKRIKELTNESV